MPASEPAAIQWGTGVSRRNLQRPPLPPENPGVQVAAAQVPGMAGLLGLAVGVVVIAALYFASDVLIPITLAVLLSFVLSPIVSALRSIRFPKGLAVIVSVLCALGVLGAIGTVVGLQAASLVDAAPGYARTIEGKIDRAQNFTVGRLARFTHVQASAPSQPKGTARGRSVVPVSVIQAEPTLISVASTILAPVLAPFETFIIVLVVAIFILLQKEDLRDRLIRVFGASDLHRATRAMDDAGSRLSRYFLSQLAVNTSFGIIVGIGLWMIGLPVPALWGILAGILRFVPYIGALLGGALPLIVAGGVDPGWTMMIGVAVLFAVVEPLVGYVVEPLLYGHSTGLSPLSVVIAAVFWTWIWGPIGLVLSMPLTLCLVVMGRHIPALEFIDVLLGDRPALTPVETFYQRMLADDPEEALDQAELLLSHRSLTAYYDEVALGGLKLAALDARRGAFDGDGARRIVDAMLELIVDLQDQNDMPEGNPAAGISPPLSPVGNEAPPEIRETAPDRLAVIPQEWTLEGSIACIAGRGVLDDAVAAMLEQLLSKRGLGASRIGHDAVGRDTVETLDLSATRLICLSYLELDGGASHLRRLIRRLHSAMPGIPIIVGMWPAGEAALTDQQAQRTIGADSYVGTLGEAVSACLDHIGRAATEKAA